MNTPVEAATSRRLWLAVQKLGRQRYLFGSLILFLLMGPAAGIEDQPGGRLVMYLVMILIFITGPLAVSRSRSSLIITFLLAMLILIPGLFASVFEQLYITRFSNLIGVAFFGYLIVLITRDLLFTTKAVSAETLWAAINVYIMIGIFFAFLFATIAYANPDAFVGKFMDNPLRVQIYGFLYFSFVTLTTLGYGDITPNTTVIGTLTYMEALIGQLYVAIMIARLVGLYVVSDDKD